MESECEKNKEQVEGEGCPSLPPYPLPSQSPPLDFSLFFAHPKRGRSLDGFVAPWLSEVLGSLLHLWLSLITFMVIQFITSLWSNFITFMFSGYFAFVVKSYYIYGQFLLHLWLVHGIYVFLITFMHEIFAKRTWLWTHSTEVFLNFAKSCILSCLSQFDNKK